MFALYSAKQIILSVHVIVVCVFVRLIDCDNAEYNLTHTLLKNYDASIRPSLYHKYAVNVTFGLALTQIIDVDERNMIVTTNCWLTQDWIDVHMSWSPESYENITSIHMPVEKLWKPDILLVNNADSWAKISTISTNLIIKFDGNVTWLSTVIFKSSCSINVRYFPFDEQVCDMIFASWTYDGFFLSINVNSKEGDTTNYIKNGEWHLVRLVAERNIKKYSCCEEPYPEIVYRLTIRRRPLFYVFNMVFPCLLITLVAFLGFYLPPDSSEKVSIGITTLLSITVFLMIVAESMPPTSEQLPLLAIYYAVTIGIVTFSTAFAVLTLNINNKGNKGGKRIPPLLRLIFFDYLSKMLRIELSHKKINFASSTQSLPRNKSKNVTLSETVSSIKTEKPMRPCEILIKPKKNFGNYYEQKLLLSSTPLVRDYFDKVDSISLNMVKLCTPDVSALNAQLANTTNQFELIHELEKVLNRQFNPLIATVLRIKEEFERKGIEKDHDELIKNEWRDVAMISDHIMCYIFSLMTITSCLIIFLNSPHIMPISQW